MKKVFGKLVLKAKKYSPELLMVAGTASIIGGTYMCCKATLQLDGTLDKSRKLLKDIDDVINHPNYDIAVESGADIYKKEDADKDRMMVKIRAGIDIAKLYAPGAGLLIFGISCYLGSYNILKTRNIALIGAYNVLQDTFTKYRNNVVEELGVEKDRDFRYGIKREKVETEVDDNGKIKKVKTEVEIANTYSAFSRIFDEHNDNWVRDSYSNKQFLICKQNFMNDLLHSRGHVFLNDVYDELGYPRTKEGAVVGWVMGNKDNYIDFGLLNSSAEDFFNGTNNSVIIDFNVDGIIYDMI